jgi:hypothetical protein
MATCNPPIGRRLPALDGGTHRGAIHSGVRIVLKAVAIALAAYVVLAAHEAVAVKLAAAAGEQATARARHEVRMGRLTEAGASLASARSSFARAEQRATVLRVLLGPLPMGGGLVAQVGAAQTLSSAAARAATATATVLEAASAARPGLGMLAKLRELRRTMAAAITTTDRAAASAAAVDRKTLATPLRDVATTVRVRLRRARTELASSLQALSALIVFVGGDGPRRYLVLSQNPDEPRPTGGFIGTYGVLTARSGRVQLRRYAAIERWYRSRRDAVIPATRAPNALQLLPRKPKPQTLANVNASPDWPETARLAARLWRSAGEMPVDGVVSLTPELVARVQRALGPVRMPGYERAVTGANVVTLLDRMTHRTRHADKGSRKRFVAQLARAIMGRLSSGDVAVAPLAQGVVRGMDAREGMVWSRDPIVQRAAAARGWDGTLPDVGGDFLYTSEFSAAAKNGRALRRRFDHRVVLRADGSARVTTIIATRNASLLGYNYRSYVALYGPRGARLDDASDRPDAAERSIAGHPAAGWLQGTPPWGTTRRRVVWDVPRMLVRRRDGSLVYRLRFMRVAAHHGDSLRLRVTPPAGWRWARRPPLGFWGLHGDVIGAWRLVPRT